MSTSPGRRAAVAVLAAVGILASLVIAGAVGVVTLVALSGSESPTPTVTYEESPGFGAVGTTEKVPCPSELVAGAATAAEEGEVEGETFHCGVVVVPEDHAKPDGRTIELFYLMLHSRSQPAASTPLVYLAGGPGSSGSTELSINPLLRQNLDKVRETRDVIAYDQRGTGYSNYLLCTPYEAALGILQDRDTDPEIAQAIKDLQDTTLGIGYGALRANLCAVGTKLLAGTDLTQYNSVSSAKDIPVLVEALGYTDGYSVYGTSYGTRLAQYALRGDPDGVRAAVLDGAVGPATPNNMWSSTKNIAPYTAIFEACAADAACNAAYPDLADRFGALLDKLEKEPLKLDPPLVVLPALSLAFPPALTQIDPQFFLGVAKVNNIALGGGFAAAVPRMILAAEQGDTDYFRSTPLAAKDQTVQPPATATETGGGGKLPIEFDQPLYELPIVTLLQVAQQAAAAQPTSLDGQWIIVALGDLAVRAAQGGDQADIVEQLLRLAALPNSGTSAEVLNAYADGNLSPQAAAAADAIAGQMKRNDVRATMWGIQDVAMRLGTEPEARGYSLNMQYAMNCSDEIAFASLDQARDAVADAAYPQLVAFPVEVNQQTLLTCLSYPSVLDKSVIEPVQTDIPVLVLLQSLDNETPIGWGRDAAKSLRAATVIEWGNAGHVVAAKDDKLCVGSITAAFLADPSPSPDISCSQDAAYKLAFVLPS